MHYYSSANNTFYPAAIQDRYKSAGTWPDDAVEVTDDEWRTYGQGEPPDGMQRGADENGRPIWVPAPEEPLEDLIARKHAEIDQARDQAFAAGLPYEIAGEPDVVQTRPQDQINLLGLSSKAQRMIADGVTDAVMPFRGQSNITRMLTPEQMDAMTLAALAHIEEVYQRSWDRKDAIAQVESGTLADTEAHSWDV